MTIRFPLLLACVVAAIATTSSAQLLYYGGDAPAFPGGFNNTAVQDGSGTYHVLDDFVVPAGTRWHVTGLFSNNVGLALSPAVTQAEWSIRTGVTPISFGTIVFGGTSPVTVTPTGRTFGPDVEKTVTVSGLSIDLDPGTYFLTVSPITASSPAYSAVPGSTNVVGTPGPDTSYQEFIESGPPGHGIVHLAEQRISMGVLGAATGGGGPAAAPALSPLGFALLIAGLAIAGLLVMRR